MGDEWGTIMVFARLRISSVPAMSGITRPGRKNPLSQHLGARVMYVKRTVATVQERGLLIYMYLFLLRNNNIKGIYGNCAS